MAKSSPPAPAAHSAPAKRKARGFLRAAELTAPAMKQAGAKRGFAELRLLTEWRAIVGEALADVCRPIKVSYKGRTSSLGATLVVAAEGARAPEIEMQTPRILEKVNQYYGYRAVSRISIDQSRAGMLAAPAPGFAEGQAAFDSPPRQPVQVDGVADDRLRLALGRLGANVKAKTAHKRAPK